MQAITTDGAHAAEFFVMQQQLFLAIANFGDRHNKRYDSASTVFRYMSSVSHDLECLSVSEGGDSVCLASNANALGQFQLLASVNTFGATDWEFFQLYSAETMILSYYLAVSEEADMQQRANSPFLSKIYQLEVLETNE